MKHPVQSTTPSTSRKAPRLTYEVHEEKSSSSEKWGCLIPDNDSESVIHFDKSYHIIGNWPSDDKVCTVWHNFDI